MNEVKDSIRPLIINALDELLAKANDSTDVHRTACNSIRGSMEMLLTNLNFNRVFVFGPNDTFFIEGMHERFVDTPQPMGTQVDREADVIELLRDMKVQISMRIN